MVRDILWYTGPSVTEEPPALAFTVKSPTVKMETADSSQVVAPIFQNTVG